MVVTPFGDLALGDDIALERFLDAHARRHFQYARQLGVPGAMLRSKVDGDWMLRHTMLHIALATGPFTTSQTNWVNNSNAFVQWQNNALVNVYWFSNTASPLDLSSADVHALALPGKWKTDRELIDWSDLHSRHHLKIDQQLNITTLG